MAYYMASGHVGLFVTPEDGSFHETMFKAPLLRSIQELRAKTTQWLAKSQMWTSSQLGDLVRDWITWHPPIQIDGISYAWATTSAQDGRKIINNDWIAIAAPEAAHSFQLKLNNFDNLATAAFLRVPPPQGLIVHLRCDAVATNEAI